MIASRNIKLLDFAVSGAVVAIIFTMGFHITNNLMTSVEVSRLQALSMVLKSASLLSKSNCIVDSHLGGCGLSPGILSVNGRNIMLLNGYPASQTEKAASLGIVSAVRDGFHEPFKWWVDDGGVYFNLNGRHDCFVAYSNSVAEPPKIFIVSKGC